MNAYRAYGEIHDRLLNEGHVEELVEEIRNRRRANPSATEIKPGDHVACLVPPRQEPVEVLWVDDERVGFVRHDVPVILKDAAALVSIKVEFPSGHSQLVGVERQGTAVSCPRCGAQVEVPIRIRGGNPPFVRPEKEAARAIEALAKRKGIT